MAADSVHTFTAHNVLLDDGTQTLPSVGFTMDQHPIIRCMRRLLHVLFPDGLDGKTIIDVGCLEGGFATEFARMGMDSTGLEIRESNYNNCLFVHSRVNLPNLRFIRGDANDIAQFGPFDIFFVSGLLYHLDTPRKFLEEVASNCRRALVLWTHITHAERNKASQTYTLSDLSENEGLHGRWYSEHGDIGLSDLDQLKWASWANKRSFWIQKEFLLQLLKEIGFDIVLEQFDCMDDIIGDMTEGFYNQIDRVMLVAVKSGLPVERSTDAIQRRGPPIELPSREAQERTLLAAQERALLAEAQARAAEEAAVAADCRAVETGEALSRAESMLQAVYSSTCWRITIPLRWAGMLLRRKGDANRLS
jgi:SAM-dependent methyltransferase